MKINESISRDILRLFIWFPFRWLVRLVPVRWGLFLFKVVGDLHFHLCSGKGDRIVNNIRTILNIDNRKTSSILKLHFENHYLDRLHIFLYPKLITKEKIARYVYFENIKIIEKELQKGKGVLVVQPHFGPVQLTLLALGLNGFNPIQIGYPSDDGLSFIGIKVAYRYRLKYEGMLPPIFAADKYLGSVYKYLCNGGLVLTTGDGAGGGVFIGEHRNMKVLGRDRMIPIGPASIALKTGVAYIPTFIIVEKFDRFRIVFEGPVRGIYNDYEKDRLYITERFIEIAEGYIKKYPYCWHFWDQM